MTDEDVMTLSKVPHWLKVFDVTPTRRFNDSVVSNPAIQGGQAVIEGTRIQAAVLCGYFQGGVKVEDIATLYGLTEKQVKDAIAFCKKRRKQHKSIWR